MPGCHVEQIKFLVYGLRFARFYFRIISLPNLSNRNHSLPKPWRRIKTHRYLVCMKDPYMFTMDVKPVSRIHKTFILLLYEEVFNCPALRMSPAVQLKQLHAHAHSVEAICAVCRRARDIRKPWIISTCISLKHYVRTPLLAR